jgi:hypothetical protein
VSRPGEQSPVAADLGVYVHGIVTGGHDAPNGARVVREGDDLGAIVGDVEADEVAGLEDSARLEETIRKHEAILERALARGPVLPLRFGTILGGDDEVRELLAANRTRFARALDSLRGKTEWGVKAFREPPASAADTEISAGGGSGRAYLERKQSERAVRERIAEESAFIADESHRRLGEQSERSVLLAAQAPAHGREMILNGAYLVRDDDHESFRAALEELAVRHGDLGITYELTGPWPSHNFASLDPE